MTAPTSRDRRAAVKHRLAALALLMAMVAVLALLTWRDPRGYGLGPMCPSLRFAGLHCPGCGSMRATHDLMHGRFASAFRNNPALLLLGVPAAAWLAASMIAIVTRGRRMHTRTPVWLGYVIAALLVAWGVARNLPGGAFDSLRPPPTSQATRTVSD